MKIKNLKMALLAIIAGWCSSHAQNSDRPFNILFIATDDLRTDLGCYGNDLVISPNIDALAENGTLFERAYCQQALCAPSRISIMTGRRPDQTQSWNLTSPIRRTDDIVTLPEHLKNNGYFTQNIGKIYHNWHQPDHVDYPRSWSVEPMLHYGTHNQDVPNVDGEMPVDSAITKWTMIKDVQDEAYYDGRIAKNAVDAIGGFAKNPDQPFFLAVGFWKPHLPFNAPKKYWDMYDKDHIPGIYNGNAPENVPEVALHDSWEFFRGNANTLNHAETLELRHGYLAAITFMDAQVGKVLNELKRTGLDKSTIVVFWSDHGFQLGEHNMWGKNSNFENDARVPLIISVPKGARSGKPTKALTELLDLYPTLMDLCGLERPEGLQGKSLVPILKDLKSSVKDAAYTQHPRPAYYKGNPDVMGYSVRTDRWRYTEWLDFSTGKLVGNELYDHFYDGQETKNLADEERYRDIVEQLHERLKIPMVKTEKSKK